MPNPCRPDLKEWLPFVLKNGKFSKDTVLIGHSAGCPLILSLLENINVKIKQAILVAGFSEPLKGIDKEPILQATYNWKSISSNVKDIGFINSDNDPWGCDDKAGRRLFDRLGGTLIVMHSQGPLRLRHVQAAVQEVSFAVEAYWVTNYGSATFHKASNT